MFSVGDRVKTRNLKDWTWKERDELTGKTGVITEVGPPYNTVHFDEDVKELIVKNDFLFRDDELVLVKD